MADDDEFYILDSRTVVGNCASFWCPDGKGYTCEIDKAGLYTLDEAIRKRETDVPVPRVLVDVLAIRHVRLDWLRDRIDIRGYGDTSGRTERNAWCDLVLSSLPSPPTVTLPQPFVIRGSGGGESASAPASGAQNAPGCPKCGCANFVIRKRCRECGENLVMHPDPEIDAEVRWDAEDGARSIRANAVDSIAARDPFDPTWTKNPAYETKTEAAHLGHLVEECNEAIEVMVPLFGNCHAAIQLVGKILRFGWTGTHYEHGERTDTMNVDAMRQILPQLLREAEDVRLAAARLLALLELPLKGDP